jgi:hypothetical protein
VSRRVAQVLVSHTDANRVFVAGESGFERSTDAGVTWTTIHTGEISDAVIDPNNADTLYINVRFDGIYKTTNGGTSWTKLAGGAPSGAAQTGFVWPSVITALPVPTSSLPSAPAPSIAPLTAAQTGLRSPAVMEMRRITNGATCSRSHRMTTA